MKKFQIFILCTILCSFLAVATIGCEKKGPMEKAGKKVDEAVDSAKDAMDKDK